MISGDCGQTIHEYDLVKTSCEVMILRHIRPNGHTGDYVLCNHTLCEYQCQQIHDPGVDFIRYGQVVLCDRWREDSEIKVEKVRDTHIRISLYV